MNVRLPSSGRPAARICVAVAAAALAIALGWAFRFESTKAEVVGNSSPTAGSRAKPSVVSEPRRRRPGLYWGAWIGSGLTGTPAPFDMGAVSAFQRLVQKRLSIIEWSSPWASCESSPCTFFGFPTDRMNAVRGYGAIPLLSWGSQAVPVADPSRPGDQPDFQLADVIAGTYDNYIRSFATTAKAWGHPFFLRFDWEPNGSWFPWGVKANGNRLPQFRTAWRHVHDIFTSVGATNTTWLWCPYVDINKDYNLKKLYPGNGYVDWTCLDGYNWGKGSPANPRPWRTFDQIFLSTYRRILTTVAPKKPMFLAELATSDYGGNKARWLRDMLRKLPTKYPRVRGFAYFNEEDRNAHWEIENSAASINAFRSGIRSGAYVPNRFGAIGSRPIRPPFR